MEWNGFDWSVAPIWLVALSLVIRLAVYPFIVLQREREKTASQTVTGFQAAEARDSATVNRLIDALENISRSERSMSDMQRETNATLRSMSEGIKEILQSQQDNRVVLNRVDETTRDTNTRFKELNVQSQLDVLRREIAVGKQLSTKNNQQNTQNYQLLVQIGRALRKKGVI